MVNTKHAILVFGPESAGNHLLVRCLIAAGCAGDADSIQRWDSQDPDAPLIVWGRSIPSNGHWPSIRQMQRRMQRLDYSCRAVVITRNWGVTLLSQVGHGRVSNLDAALTNIRWAYTHIFEELDGTDMDWWLCHYDHLIKEPRRELGYLCGALGLPMPAVDFIRDENAKYGEQT
jgi:hypothetical protein